MVILHALIYFIVFYLVYVASGENVEVLVLDVYCVDDVRVISVSILVLYVPRTGMCVYSCYYMVMVSICYGNDLDENYLCHDYVISVCTVYLQLLIHHCKPGYYPQELIVILESSKEEYVLYCYDSSISCQEFI